MGRGERGFGSAQPPGQGTGITENGASAPLSHRVRRLEKGKRRRETGITVTIEMVNWICKLQLDLVKDEENYSGRHRLPPFASHQLPVASRRPLLIKNDYKKLE